MRIRIKQKWGFALLLVVTVIYLSLSVFDDWNKEEKVTEIYFADRLTGGLRILIDKYNRINEGKVKVITIDFPNDDFSTNERKEILARLLRSGVDEIDVFAVDLIWVQRFTKWCEPLDKYFTEDEIGRILPTALESCYFDGELHALPLELAHTVLYYREDLIRKNPNADKILSTLNGDLTWEKLRGLKKYMGNEPFFIFPAADYEGLICIFMEMVLGKDPEYFYKHGFDFNTTDAEEALGYLVALVNESKITPPDVVNFTEVPSYDYFLDNNYEILHGWQSYDKDFTSWRYDMEKQKHLRKCLLPRFSDGQTTTLFGGWNIMVSRFSNKKKEVIDFMKFLIQEESQEILYNESGYLPVVSAFYDDEKYLNKYPEIKSVREMLNSGIHRPAHKNYTKYSKIMSCFFERAIRGEMSVKKALREASIAIRNDKILVREFTEEER